MWPVEREVHFLDAVALGAGAELGLRARRAAAEQDAFVTVHCASPASCDHSIRHGTHAAYRAGESIEDFCRACKTDRMHTVVAADADGRPIRVDCGYCHSEHNYRGGARIGAPSPACATALQCGPTPRQAARTRHGTPGPQQRTVPHRQRPRKDSARR